jgi:hypothetical protein
MRLASASLQVHRINTQATHLTADWHQQQRCWCVPSLEGASAAAVHVPDAALPISRPAKQRLPSPTAGTAAAWLAVASHRHAEHPEHCSMADRAQAAIEHCWAHSVAMGAPMCAKVLPSTGELRHGHSGLET